MRPLRTLLVIGLGCLALIAEARADFQYVIGQPRAIGVGGTTDVKVYLQETVTSGGSSVLATDGLSSASVRLLFSDPSVAMVLHPAGIVPNARAFGISTTTLAPGFADITEVIGPSSRPARATEVAQGTYRILIGDFRFKGLAAGNASVTAGDIPGRSGTITGTGLVLDARVGSGVGSLSVSGSVGSLSVPEPSSMILLGVGLLGVLGHAGRSRRRAAARPAE